MRNKIDTSNWAKTMSKVVSRISKKPISEKEIDGLIDKAIENVKKLNSCKGPHDFVPAEGEKPGKNARRLTCAVCGGSVDGHGKLWYERGLKHGRGETC